MTDMGEICRICSAIFGDFEENLRYAIHGTSRHESAPETSPHRYCRVVVNIGAYLPRLHQQRSKVRVGPYERCSGDFANCPL